MATRVRTLSVNLTAGTAKFFTELDAANGKLRQFGQTGVTEARATAAAMKSMEGQFFNNTRAADKFIETVLGGGPLLKAAFPVVGGIAFAGMLSEITSKAYEFYKSIRDAGEKSAGAFREMAAPLRLTNDELELSNVRLANQIAVLQGKHENTLAAALMEARVQADRLAESLDKDLATLHKVLGEQNVSVWRKIWGGLTEGKEVAGTGDIGKMIGGETGYGGFRGDIARITEEGNEKIRQATTLKQRDAAQTELNTRLTEAYAKAIGAVKTEIDKATAAAKPQTTTVKGYRGYAGSEAMPDTTLTTPGKDEAARLELLQAARRQLEEEQRGIGLQSTAGKLQGQKEALEGAAKGTDPFSDRMLKIGAEIDGLKAKLAAIGQPEAAQILAKAFGEAQKAIEETDKTLRAHGESLTDLQAFELYNSEVLKASIEAEDAWRTKLAQTNTSIADRIRSTDALTAAIGKGYEATRQANVETRLMQELGQHYGDQQWMQDHAADVAGLRTGYGREFDAEHAKQSGEAVQKLQEQIELERALARVQGEGAEAVRQVTLALRIRQLVMQGASMAQMQAEVDLYNAQRSNVNATDVAKIDERIAATQRLTAALSGGAEAERRAALENKYAEMQRAGAPAATIDKQRADDAAEHEREITSQAMRRGLEYQNQLEAIEQQIPALEKILESEHDNVAAAISLRDLENERLRLLAQESLALGTARDGFRAFFIEMQENARSAAVIVYDTLNTALDRVSGNFAKLMTGQKTDWGKAFQQTGEQMAQQSVKSLAQKGLGEVGKLFGLNLGGGTPKGSGPNDALWVRWAEAGGLLPGAGGGAAANASGAMPNLLKRSGGWLAKLFGFAGGGGGDSGAAGGGGEQIGDLSHDIDFGGFMAEGGSVDPGKAYITGDGGEPEWFLPGMSGSIVPQHALGGITIQNNVDARGADLGASNRLARALEASHRASVATAVQVMHERTLRTPQK